MNKFLIRVLKNVQTFVSTITKKRETVSVDIFKKAESFVFKLYTNMNMPFYNPKPYAYITVFATVGYNLTAGINKISALTGETITIDWGDGTIENLTGDNTDVEHVYSDTGTYTIKFRNPDKIKVLEIDGDSGYDKFTITSKGLIPLVNIETLVLYYPTHGSFNSSHLKHLRPTYFQLQYPAYGEDFITKFNSADVADWRPETFRLGSLGYFPGVEVTLNSSDISLWRPTDFYIYLEETPPENIHGTFNSSDVALWTPSNFGIAYVSAEFNSSDISSWVIPVNNSFSLRYLKEGSTGTFDTGDLVNPPSAITISSMPSTYNIVISPNSLSSWTNTVSFDLSNNRLSQSTIDNILKQFYDGFVNRTSSGGGIYLGWSWSAGEFENATPSGFYEASASPTYGQQYRYELINDSTNRNPTKKWGSVYVEDINTTMAGNVVSSDGLYLGYMKVSGGSVAVNWGNFGMKEIYADGYEGYFFSSSSHAQTGNVIVYNLDNITKINFTSPVQTGFTTTFTFSEISKFKNLTSFIAGTNGSSFYYSLNTSYLSSLPINDFQILAPQTGSRVINTSDMSSWVITETFRLTITVPSVPTGNINTAHMFSWNPKVFILSGIPDSMTGTISTEHITYWSAITDFSIYDLPSTIGGTFYSGSIAPWTNMVSFGFQTVLGTFTGHIDTFDFQDKSMNGFQLSNIPAGITGNIDSSYFSSYSMNAVSIYNLHSGITGTVNTSHFASSPNLGLFNVYDNLGIVLTITADSFSGIYNLYYLNIKNNSLTRASVDQMLSDLWDAFLSRSLPFGTAYLDGNNSSPSGVYQPGNPPDTGYEYAYELKNDTQNVSSGIWSNIFLSSYVYDTISSIDGSALSTLDSQTLLEIEVVD